MDITGVSCHKYHFGRDKHVFVATKRNPDVFVCRDKNKPRRVCRDKNDTCGSSRQR